MEVTCDIRLIRPDNSYSINAENVECASWSVPPNAFSLMLTQTIIQYVGEVGDLPGKWSVFVTLKDKHAGIEIPLKTEFNLVVDSVNTYEPSSSQ